jgi:hypothetical protein
LGPRELGEGVSDPEHGGRVRAEDGRPIAGFHTGHWEIGLQVRAAAEELRRLGTVPFAAACSDPCDGRTQGTVGMFDSLPYRNDAAQVFRRLIRSLPTRAGVIGVATCDKGLPAMMMALAGVRNMPAVIVPGGVSLPPTRGEDAGKIQTIGVRYAHNLITLAEAAELGCRACATPGGGCQFLGTAATSQLVAKRWTRAVRWRRRGAGVDGDRAAGGAVGGRARAPRAAAAGHRDGGEHPERDGGARRVRGVDESPAAHPGDRARRRVAAARGGGLDRGEPPCAAAGQRAAQRSGITRRCGSSWPAAFPSRCTCGVGPAELEV